MESSSGMSQGQETQISSPSVESSSSNVVQDAPQTQERTFRQSEVSDIVKKAKYGAVEDFKRMQSERPDYVQQKYGETHNNHAQSNTQTSAYAPEETIRRLAAEEAQRHSERLMQEAKQRSESEQAQTIVQNFWQKMSLGKEKFEDFDKATGDIEYARFPNVVQILSAHIDNAAEVMHHLGNDRIKMANLEQLALMSPRDAIVHAQRLSQSLKDNEAAGRYKTPNEPLSKMRPSNHGSDTGAALSMKDLKAKYRA
jgi:hypothetical protein